MKEWKWGITNYPRCPVKRRKEKMFCTHHRNLAKWVPDCHAYWHILQWQLWNPFKSPINALYCALLLPQKSFMCLWSLIILVTIEEGPWKSLPWAPAISRIAAGTILSYPLKLVGVKLYSFFLIPNCIQWSSWDPVYISTTKSMNWNCINWANNSTYETTNTIVYHNNNS